MGISYGIFKLLHTAMNVCAYRVSCNTGTLSPWFELPLVQTLDKIDNI